MSFAIVNDAATPHLRGLSTRLADRGHQRQFLLNWAVRVRQEAIRRCLAKGGRRFWRDVARSIAVETDSNSMTVAANHRAAAQKQFGGVIEAKGRAAGGADALTIPLPGTEAEGTTAARFTAAGVQLFALPGPDGEPSVLGYSDDGDFRPLFALVRRTKPQRPDPFMPEEPDVAQYGIEEAIHILNQ